MTKINKFRGLDFWITGDVVVIPKHKGIYSTRNFFALKKEFILKISEAVKEHNELIFKQEKLLK